MNYDNRRPNQRPSSGGGRQSFSRGGDEITSAPPVKLFIDDAKDKINPELLDSIAWEQAEKLHRDVNSAQLRRFFGDIKGLYNRLEHQEPFDRLLPLIKMMKSKVYYSVNPKKPKIPKEFASFLLGGIDQIKDEKDFRAIVLYFEAVVGFIYGKGLVSK